MDHLKDTAILFINIPTGTTTSLRDLPTTLSLADLKAKLELAAGYPSNAYSLFYGKTALLLEREALFGTLHSGAVLRMVIRPNLEHMCRFVATGDEDAISRNFKSNDKENIEYLFLAAYISAFNGSVTLLRTILNKSPSQLLSCQTVFGRSLAHVATASDHPQTLQVILLQSAKLGISPLMTDHFNKTPADVLKEYSAVLCERLIRNFNHHRRGGSLHLLTSGLEEEKQEAIQSENKRKSRAKSAIVKSSYKRTNSSVSFDSSIPSHGESRMSRLDKKNISYDALTESSGYQTQENLADSVPNDTLSNGYVKERSDSAMKQQKKVKFMARIKSAPPKVSQNITNDSFEDKRISHNKCYHKKPFLAFREVPFEELKPQSVEYVPLNSTHFIGMDAKARERSVMSMLSQSERSIPDTPYSSLDSSLQEIRDVDSQSNDKSSESAEEHDIKYSLHQTKGGFIQTEDPRALYKENMKQLNKRFTNPKTATTKRAQSANYYCANYHIRTAKEKLYDEIPPPRPKTANSRYRAWKPWLLQLYKEQAANKKQEKRTEDKRQQNLQAFKRWLKQKQVEEDEASSDYTDDSDDDRYYSDGETYEQWLKRKKPVLEKMDKKRLEQKKRSKKKPLVDRNVTIYELCSTDSTVQKVDSPYTYMYAFQKWQSRKKKYENWKFKQGLEAEAPANYTSKNVQDMKKALYLDGFTYNEWLGHKHRDRIAQKKSVTFS